MIKRLVYGLICAACYLAGVASNPRATVTAQGQQAQQAQPGGGGGLRALAPPTRAEHGKAMYFNIEDIKKKFTNEKVMTATHLAWDPFYRFTVMTRAYYDPPRTMNASKTLSNWDDAEMHENKTQIYVMVAGTGVLALGGEPATQRTSPDGQHSGGPLKGATMQRVNPGDWVVIPPYAWHQAQPDPGQTMTYGMCHIETRNLMP